MNSFVRAALWPYEYQNSINSNDDYGDFDNSVFRYTKCLKHPLEGSMFSFIRLCVNSSVRSLFVVLVLVLVLFVKHVPVLVVLVVLVVQQWRTHTSIFFYILSLEWAIVNNI